MSSWRRFRSLSAADRVIVMEAGALMLFIRVAIAAAPFLVVRRALRASAWMTGGGARTRDIDTSRVAWAITAAARHLPFRTTCLVESLAAEGMLLRRGVPCVLQLGVRAPQSGRALDAHAWIECRGDVVAGAVEGLAEYVVLADKQ
jgi:hypothetical protein